MPATGPRIPPPKGGGLDWPLWAPATFCVMSHQWGSSGSQWSYKHLPMIPSRPSFWEESIVAFAYGKSRVHVGPMWMIRVGEFHFQGFTISCGSKLQVPPLPFASAAPRPSMRRQSGILREGYFFWHDPYILEKNPCQPLRDTLPAPELYTDILWRDGCRKTLGESAKSGGWRNSQLILHRLVSPLRCIYVNVQDLTYV